MIDTLDESKFVENQLKGSKYVELSDFKRTDLRANTDSTIRVEHNVIAAQILRDGIVDLASPEIKVGSLNLQELQMVAGNMDKLSEEDQ